MSARIVDFFENVHIATWRKNARRYLNSDDSRQRDEVATLEILWESVNIELDGIQKTTSKNL